MNVFELQLADELLRRIRAIDGRYHERAYLFVLAALEYCQRKRKVRGHIRGDELAWACRDLAQEQFGLTSRTVLSYWGIDDTSDIGRIVFVLIDVGLLMPNDEDRQEDFGAVYDFEEAFEEEYPWAGVSRTSGGV
jgi:uncharacterized repeat protein (TIGR04138 family)